MQKAVQPEKVSFVWQIPEQYLWGFIQTVGYVNLRKRRTSRSQAVHFHIETMLKRLVFFIGCNKAYSSPPDDCNVKSYHRTICDRKRRSVS